MEDVSTRHVVGISRNFALVRFAMRGRLRKFGGGGGPEVLTSVGDRLDYSTMGPWVRSLFV